MGSQIEAQEAGQFSGRVARVQGRRCFSAGPAREPRRPAARAARDRQGTAYLDNGGPAISSVEGYAARQGLRLFLNEFRTITSWPGGCSAWSE